jgi:hypothetical protein
MSVSTLSFRSGLPGILPFRRDFVRVRRLDRDHNTIRSNWWSAGRVDYGRGADSYSLRLTQLIRPPVNSRREGRGSVALTWRLAPRWRSGKLAILEAGTAGASGYPPLPG